MQNAPNTILLFLDDSELIWKSFVILYWRAGHNSGLCSWPSAYKLNSPSLASWLVVFPLSFPSQTAVILQCCEGPCQLQPSLTSRVLISSDHQKVLALVALNFLAPLGLRHVDWACQFHHQYKTPMRCSLCHHDWQHSRSWLLCQSGFWSRDLRQPYDDGRKNGVLSHEKFGFVH